jgi:hypothetical protein
MNALPFSKTADSIACPRPPEDYGDYETSVWQDLWSTGASSFDWYQSDLKFPLPCSRKLRNQPFLNRLRRPTPAVNLPGCG